MKSKNLEARSEKGDRDASFSLPNSHFSLQAPALLPKLRFPEFQNARGWDCTTLGSIGFFMSGGTPSKDNPDYWNGSIPWISASSMYDFIVEKADHYVTPLAIGKGTRVAKKGSILILVRGSMLFNRVPICIAGVDVAFNQDVKALEVNASIDTHFLLYQLTAFQDYFPINETGIGAGKIELEHLKGFNLVVPSLPEQQKIAECLSSLDELLAAQARKVDALKTHKKGLMQQLFPREGETQPRLRFPEFQNAGEWEFLTVSQFANVTTGAKDTQNKVENGKYPFFVRSQTVERIDSFSYDGEAVLTSGDGVGVGKNFHHINGKFDFHQRVYCIYGFDEAVSGLFFYLYFSEHFGERVMRMSAKNSVDSVRMAMITEMPIMVPSVPEQHRIAACVSSLDARITAETRKLEALKTHKRGLMQQLFPSPPEVAA